MSRTQRICGVVRRQSFGYSCNEARSLCGGLVDGDAIEWREFSWDCRAFGKTKAQFAECVARTLAGKRISYDDCGDGSSSYAGMIPLSPQVFDHGDFFVIISVGNGSFFCSEPFYYSLFARKRLISKLRVKRLRIGGECKLR